MKKEIDEFIRDTQRNAKSYTSYLEWIPFEDFEDVKQIAKGGFGTVYHSWWKTGERIDDALDEHLTPYKRERSEKIPVALKRLNNSQSVSSEFLDEVC
jgi:serine/threonine protein kinase